ncbi:hypothetical protein DYB34_012268 [Aphanomyces astaci]|uniref:Uncharacterized protein n=1 Tax=Aphanomyces astaci TaxID=112090 RepID=A0A418BBX4_APHAT|nr:hypothetical protein DYB34_012268 [Aphanomyces astaci]
MVLYLVHLQSLTTIESQKISLGTTKMQNVYCADIDMAKLKTPSKKELIEENRVLRAEMQAATFMIPLVGQPETPSEPRAAVEPKFSANYTDQMIVALLEVRFGWFRDDFAGSKSNK